MGVMIVVQRQADLLEVVFALRPPGSLPCLLHGRQKGKKGSGLFYLTLVCVRLR